jgi:glutamate-ammonia-ligase adenylyltransferase
MAESSDEILQTELAALPDVLRRPVALWLVGLAERDLSLPDAVCREPALARTLLCLIATSEFAASALLKHWTWFAESLAAGRHEDWPNYAGWQDALRADIAASADPDRAKRALRQLRNRGLLQILWQSTDPLHDLWASLRSLSELADLLVEAAMRAAEEQLEPRFGQAIGSDGKPIPLITLAMGKLGGGELNFSSDIDLVFLYTEDGETSGPRTLSAHEYFGRLSHRVVNLLDDVTADGFVYRVDTRLRPFGDSGPAVVSFAALENYLLQHGRSWERYAYVKARVISPGASQSVIDELQSEIIDPFVYRRYLDYGVFESLRDMKALIEREVRKRELAGNVKLGPGGIREIEFIVQSLQLVRGGNDRKLRRRELREALRRLGDARGLGPDAASRLTDAYVFLRRLENGLQAIRDRQTHDVPEDETDRARLALLMGFTDWAALAEALDAHREEVSVQFAAVAFRGDDPQAAPGTVDDLASRWAEAAEPMWLADLEGAGYAEPERIAASVAGFAAMPVQRQIDTTARKRLDRFMKNFITMLLDRRRPGKICERVLGVISQVVRRSAYLSLLNENPSALGRLISVCERSGYLSQELERYPLLLDELLDPRVFTVQMSATTMREGLHRRLEQVDADDSEATVEVLARFQRATLFRIAVADVSGALPIMKVSDRLTELAEIVVEKALEIAWDDLTAKHGRPGFDDAGQRRSAGLGVIAYGKFGGIELSYGSDLDLVFLHDSRGGDQNTDGEKPLDNAMFFGRLVRRLVHFLTAQTSSGALYEVDTRLRPSGRSGLLVVSVEGFARYQEENAWTWEHQALLRSRPVAGSAAVARAFGQIRVDTLTGRIRRESLLDDVLSMRAKMRKQLDKSSTDAFDLKQGRGGIGDIEFLVQYLVLSNADSHPTLLHYPDNIRQLGVLGAVGLLEPRDVARLQEAYRCYRRASHRLALDGKPAIVSAVELTDEREFVCSLWEKEMKSPTPSEPLL